MLATKTDFLNKEKLLCTLNAENRELRYLICSINENINDIIILLDFKKHITACSESFNILVGNRNILGESFIKIMNEIIYLPDDFFREKSYFVKVREKNPERVFFANIEKYSVDFENNYRYIVILKEMTKESEIQAQKDNFIATLTHDLKTPVRADIMSLELLLKGKFGDLSAEQTEILSEMLNSNKFMMNMLDTLLAKYKYENGGVDLLKRDFELNIFIKEIVKELKCLFEEKNIKCEFASEKEEIPVHADKIELKRAISNLISNAIKFNNKGGFVKISVFQNKKEIKIKVEDNGIGMSKDKLEHIFDKYVSYAKRFRQLGTGLGLYVAKKIIEAHGGKIEVLSTPKEGSVFTVTIPQKAKK